MISAMSDPGNPSETLATVRSRAGVDMNWTEESYQFPGQGQRPTPVTDAKGLVIIMNLLPGNKAARFRAACASIIVRFLGGDEALLNEIRANGHAQQSLPEEHPARVFGESVEAGARKRTAVDYDPENREMEQQLRRKSFDLKMQEEGVKLQEMQHEERVRGIKNEEEIRALREKLKRGIEEEKKKFGSKQKAYSRKADDGVLVRVVYDSMHMPYDAVVFEKLSNALSGEYLRIHGERPRKVVRLVGKEAKPSTVNYYAPADKVWMLQVAKRVGQA
jgi:hypothetical protein